MKAIAVRRGENKPRVIEKSVPDPKSDEALVRTLRVGIDGTDHEVIAGGHGGFPEDDDHLVLGHEAIGVVAEPNETRFSKGDLVVPTVRRPPAGVKTNEYFERGEPDMAPDGEYVERGIVGAHGYMSEYFTASERFLVDVPTSFAEFGFLIEPLSNVVKALELATASRSTFRWEPERAIVLGNGSLGLLAVALLASDDRFEHVYGLGRRDRPDPTIDIIERLDATYVDSRETPVAELGETYGRMDFVCEATGYARHAFDCIEALSAAGVAALLGIPSDRSFEIDGGALHREFVLENKALVGSVNSHVPHFESAVKSLSEFPDWFVSELITGVFAPTEVERAFGADESTIKSTIEFDTLS